MGRVLDFAEKAWHGTIRFSGDSHPMTIFLGLEDFGDGSAFISSFSNLVVVDTSEGLVLVDSGAHLFARQVFADVRAFSDKPVHSVIFTHGHIDHVLGIHEFDREADEKGWPRAQIVAHEALAARLDRYKLTAGYNGAINARQFRVPGLQWPTDYRYPDRTYRGSLTLEIGAERFELHHDRGETDDSTWIYLPERRILCSGDLFIWAVPNCGNPQKVQRYPLDWARALRKMAELDAERLLPGHGPPIIGAERVRLALSETAALLESICEQTLALMNRGSRLDEVLQRVEFPAALLERPYLKPVYDEPTFIVRNLWRLYGGWYDGNPAHLKPAPDAVLAAELARLSGGADVLAQRAAELADAGELALATQLVQLAADAEPQNERVREQRAAIYRRRSASETSLMAKSIYRAAAEE